LVNDGMAGRIHPRRSGPDLARIARFEALSVALISDAMDRLPGVGWPLRAMHAVGERRMVGPAFTVRTRPGDNLLVHKALDLARPGDVVVVDAGGSLENAILGELMAAYAEMRGLCGIVVDGAIRDSAAIARSPFPVFAAGVTHRGPWKSGPGEINGLVTVGRLTIAPGDLVCGDADGLVAIPPSHVDEVLAWAEARQVEEARQMSEIQAGRWDRSWLDAALDGAGCLAVEDPEDP
jgi:regulator of RNase E activity RraA